MLTDNELNELSRHLDRVGSDPLFEKEFYEVTRVRINRTTLRAAIKKSTKTSLHVENAVRDYLRKMHSLLLALHHLNRYTGRLMFAATHPKTMDIFSEVLSPHYANPDLLYRRLIPVTDFKKATLRAIDARGVPLHSICERGLALPGRIAFVNHTGQWLKPVLRKLLKHPQTLKIEVYVCDPTATHHHNEHPEWAEVLGVLEFLWSLPTSLDLTDANPSTCLDIYTYDASKETRRLAFFQGDLVARTPQLDHLDEKKRPRGHPGVEAGARCILAPSSVEIALAGATEFESIKDDVENCLLGGRTPLPGLSEKRRIRFTAGEFTGLLGDGRSGDHLFDIDPRKYICKPGSNVEAKNRSQPGVCKTDLGRSGGL